MKKTIVLLLLCLSLLLSFAACAAEKHDLLYETEIDAVTYRVRGSGSRAKQIVLKKEDAVIWSQAVNVSSTVGSLGGNYGFEVLDLNFDGHKDFMIADNKSGDAVSYICWLWDEDEADYVRSEALSGLCNVQADSEMKAIFAFSHTYEYEKAYADAPASSITTDSATKYQWLDGKLIPAIRVSIIYYSETDLYCYSVAYYDAELEEFGDSDDVWLTPEEYKEQDMSFLYYFK